MELRAVVRGAQQGNDSLNRRNDSIDGLHDDSSHHSDDGKTAARGVPPISHFPKTLEKRPLPPALAVTTPILSEFKHSDGRIDRQYIDGKREAIFPSGLRKSVWPNGSAIVNFPNGDFKETSEDGIVTYQYYSTGCVQTTFPDGVEVLKFASGQTEKHFPDGTKEIIFPNKMVKRIDRNGSVEVSEVGGGWEDN